MRNKQILSFLLISSLQLILFEFIKNKNAILLIIP